MEIGRSTPEPNGASIPAERAGKEREPRVRALLHSLTNSLDLACRGYLCMQLVDCDPLTDPDCGPSGKKVVVRETAAVLDRALTRAAPLPDTTLHDGRRNPAPVVNAAPHAVMAARVMGASADYVQESADAQLSGS